MCYTHSLNLNEFNKNELFTLLTYSRGAPPVVAVLPWRAAELQAHRSFCCRAIVRTAAVAQGMNRLSHSFHTPCAIYLILSYIQSLFTLILHIVPLFSIKHTILSPLSYSLFVIEQTCFIHSVLSLDFLCYLTTVL